ncbi:MAG: ABC transporter substrate-binding protein [Desulfarculaceae bacterium]|nr:ABC transporter substrate-binding protein [Desulfarculaceae bacterium]MCF8071626.1 ABC transporter substrate-binding protein [Desulfarculaceae bacterium]MCF8103177.1 ABC transporter substrate-binding protein [Desulfarculaceae bacterium]MCF8114905.1 ABC transporter substrate-binding protein [Desulfarculaceae bacterium]
MRKIAILAAIAIMVALLVPAMAVAGPKEIKIGVIYPLTGPAAAAGRELRNGAELAAEIANNVMPKVNMTMAKNAGVKSLGGAKITLIFKDHQGNPQMGADLAKKLILDDKVVGILGCYYSSVTKTVSAVCERYGVPMINGSSTSPTLTKRGFKWFWRTTPHDKWFTKDLFEFLVGLTKGKVKGVKAVPMAELKNLAAACEKTEWGSNVSIEIANFAKEYGFDLKANILYAAKSPDLSSEVQSMIATKPGAMLFASYTSDALLMVKTLKSMKAKPKVVWGQDAGFDKPEFRALGAEIEGILTRSVFLPSVVKVKPLAGEVNAMYQKKHGHDMDGASARAFTGLQTWVYVLEKAGSTKPKAIQQAANTISIPGNQLVVPWVGIKFSTKGDEIGQNVLGNGLIGQYQMKDGKIGLEVVYPFDMATAPMIFPFKGF